MNHVMIDLETMGTTPGCAIVSIGAVQFDLDTGKTGAKFYQTVDIRSCLNHGLTISGDTLMWWLKQNDQAREKLSENPTDLHDALIKLTQWLDDKFGGNVIPWGNSASFDLGILAAAYNAVKLNIPWNFYNEKCFRTMKALFPVNTLKKDGSRAHDPIYDCEYQISVLAAISRNIRGKVIV